MESSWSDLSGSLLFYLLILLTCTSTCCVLCHLSDYGYIRFSTFDSAIPVFCEEQCLFSVNRGATQNDQRSVTFRNKPTQKSLAYQDSFRKVSSLTHWHTTFYNTWRTCTYIYIYIYMERLFLMFLDHTQRRSKVGRTPLDE